MFEKEKKVRNILSNLCFFFMTQNNRFVLLKYVQHVLLAYTCRYYKNIQAFKDIDTTVAAAKLSSHMWTVVKN